MLLRVRSQERKAVLGTFIVLFGVLAGHTLVETARDALFLAKLPATDLLLSYVAIAVISLLLSQFSGRRGRRALGLWLLISAGVTTLFWWLSVSNDPWVLYAIYVWSGVFISIALVQYWILLGQVFSLEQAKRLYGPIGAGSLLGATVGALAATGMSQVMPARHLLLAGAALFALSGGLTLWLLRGLTPVSKTSLSRPAALPTAIRRVFDDPYVGRLAALVAVSTAVFTMVDFLFKAEVASSVEPERLAETFGLIYVLLNATAFLSQIILTAWLLRFLGVQRVLLILPVLLLGGAILLAIGGGVLAAIALKGADGTFKHSLHRTASEVLFIPISDRLRPNAKRFIDMVGRRAAQALTSLVVLGVVYLGGQESLGLLLAMACIAWVILVRRLKPHYLAVVRAHIRSDYQGQQFVVEPLDLSALEALMSSLNSTDDGEVLTAMELLAAAQRTHLIPGLLLYHPSRVVVVRALELFADSHRVDHLPVVERLSKHGDPHIRAAVLRTHSSLVRVVQGLDDRSPQVRATALVSLVVAGDDVERAFTELGRLVDGGGARDRTALADAIASGVQVGHAFTPLLLRMITHKDVRTTNAVVRAMGAVADPQFIDVVMHQLARREVRSHAREALVKIGGQALDALDTALAERRIAFVIRRHIPRVISDFGTVEAARILLSHLLDEPSGMIRYRILRSLERMRVRDRALPLDDQALDAALSRTLKAGYTLLGWRVRFQRLASQVSRDVTTMVGYELMLQLMADKEEHASERLLRLLNLWHRDEDFDQIYRGLRSSDTVVASSSLELLANVVRAPHTEAVVGLVSGLVGIAPDEERLTSGGTYREKIVGEPTYEGLLMEVLSAPSDSLRALAAYHIGELGWRQLSGELQLLAASVEPESFAAHAISRAIQRLGATEASEVRDG